MRAFFFIGLMFCFSACKVEHHHNTPPHPGSFPTCELSYTYYPNAAPGALSPFVTCVVHDAFPYSTVLCSMEFRADSLPLVGDRREVPTDYYGFAEVSVSNGNCYLGETVTLRAECVVNGRVLDFFDIGYLPCGT